MAHFNTPLESSGKRAAQWKPSTIEGCKRTRHVGLDDSKVRALASIFVEELPKMTKRPSAQSETHISEAELCPTRGSASDSLDSLVDCDSAACTRYDTPPCDSSAFESGAILGQAPKKPKIARASDHGNPAVLQM